MGIDVGSRTTKALIWDGREALDRIIVSTGWSPEESAQKAYGSLLESAGLRGVDSITVTGYGRSSPNGFRYNTVTEITAHARGVGRLLPGVRTLIDIGGQDSKAILLEEGGLVVDFAMNDRCAAGSGKFLEFLALTMDLSVEEFAELAANGAHPVQISSICTVFAESEVLSLLAEGESKRNVAAGVHRSIASRVGRMVKSLHYSPPVAFSGGVARNKCMVKELSRQLSSEVVSPEYPEFAGALGAAIIAFEGI